MKEGMSDAMAAYFKNIKRRSNEAHEIAEEARSQGYDPEDFVEVKLAENLAERVVGLISSVAPQIQDSGVVERIQDLENEYGALDWRVCLSIALDVAEQRFCEFEDEVEAMETGIRTGLAYLSLGVVSAPLEGFTELQIKETRDGDDYFCLHYAGPVRAAGGTAASVSVLIADYVRKQMGYAPYDPTEKEIKRCHAELTDYHEYVANLQYYPSKAESEFMMEHLPVEINGDPSQRYEVSNARLKNIDRVGTPYLRSGYCLIHSSCLPLKAAKMWKRLSDWGHDFDMEQWDFLEEFLNVQKQAKSESDTGSEEDQEEDDEGEETDDQNSEKKDITPNYTYIQDLVGGRPVLGHPLEPGGFRLRYGRSRASGMSAQSVHPATMAVTDDFLAIGTQLKTERPGKAAAYSSCDTIEGPTVKLVDGEVIQLESAEQAKRHKKNIDEILFLGDVLINYGDFLERAQPLIPAGYTEERWALEIQRWLDQNNFSVDDLIESLALDNSFKDAVNDPLRNTPSQDDALTVAQDTSISLHPAYTYYFSLLDTDELNELTDYVEAGKQAKESLVLPLQDEKALLETIGVPHRVLKDKYVVVDKPHATTLHTLIKGDKHGEQTVLKELSARTNMDIRDKAGTFIGSRMGRPEKAKMRELKGSPHVLFPVGEEGGRLRSFNAARDKGQVTSNFQLFKDSEGNITPHRISEKTDEPADIVMHESERDDDEKQSYTWTSIDINEVIRDVQDQYDVRAFPDLVKGVRGTSNEEHVAEHLLKGILRAKHDISVNKDGTIRYDCSELALTHFKPGEVHVSVDKLRSLGYETDINGDPLENPDQICELKPQDVVLPSCDDAPEPASDVVLKQTCDFVDELLVTLYGLEPYYEIETREDLVGELIIGLAPHTSAGMVGRIIGFHDGQTFSAHPYMHAAMRRDCDGDETCFVLLLDAFLNFSQKYLPNRRGSTMDAPLVLTSTIKPTEVDDMIFNVDTLSEYPLELYEAADNHTSPTEVDIDIIGDKLGTPDQFENIGFTHDTTNMNDGVTVSAYKTLPSMDEKVEKQMRLAEKIRAVHEPDVAELMINKHFLRDTKGNLGKFSEQEFRCVNCNEKYRRSPLSGKCEECGGKIIFTINEGGITKYMDLSLDLAYKYDIDSYTKQVIELAQERIDGVFGREMEVQTGLDEFT